MRVLWGQRQRLTRDDADQVLHSMLALTRGAGEYEGKRLCDGLVAQLAAWKAEHPDLQVRVRRGRVIHGRVINGREKTVNGVNGVTETPLCICVVCHVCEFECESFLKHRLFSVVFVFVLSCYESFFVHHSCGMI